MTGRNDSLSFYGQHDVDYLAHFYKKETKNMMERGMSKRMVALFYRETLKYNSMRDEPEDLSGLERLLCAYVTH
jgi:hypothetical protein